MTTIAGLAHSGDLSRFMTSGGCAAKVDSVTLEGILGGLASPGPVDAIVGLESRDDAAVVALPGMNGMVTTVDMIPPPVADPREWGWIAASNAISDVYAMGGQPLWALSILGIPRAMSGDDARCVVLGALDCLAECGAGIVGGHTIRSEAPFFGLAVHGTVFLDNIWRKSGALVGDAVILTRPIGVGVALSAARSGLRAMGDETWRCLKTTNAVAAEVLRGFPVHAATDVTGFGLANQVIDVAKSSAVAIHLDLGAVPEFEDAVELAADGVATSLTAANRRAADPNLRAKTWGRRADLLFDPQTNGGLLATVPAECAADIVIALRRRGLGDAAVIGRVHECEGPRLVF